MKTDPNATVLTAKAAMIKRNREQFLNASGENFNIFSLLNIEYDEARLHSRFIADLLSPGGKHGKKALFLQLFLQVVNLPPIAENLLQQAKVYTEEHVGAISQDWMEGGQIDIVIKVPHDLVIVIENKINAGDQKHQLIRYKNRYPNAYLLYLTKFGNKPSPYSTHDQATGKQIVEFDNDLKHILISYESHILAWLESCYKEVTRQSLLRENIFQYITTVKKITNQLTDNTMSTEIANSVLSSNENLEGFFAIRTQTVLKTVERHLLYKFIDETIAIATGMALEYDAEHSNTELGHKEDDTEIAFRVPGTPFSFVYGFNTWRADFCVGVSFSGEKDENIKQELSQSLSVQLGQHTDYPKWYYLLYMKDSKLGDEYLSTWHEGLFDIWGRVNDGTVAKRIGWYFKTFLNEIRGKGIAPQQPGKITMLN